MPLNETKQMPAPNMAQKTWKPLVAAILNFISAAMVIGYLIAAFIGYGYAWQALVWLPMAIPPVVGGIFALRRKIWWLALVSSILAMNWPAVILIIISKKEFK